jgi:DNA processing protein
VPDADLAFWLRLAAIPGVGGETQRALLAAFGLPDHMFSAAAASLARVVPAQSAEMLLRHDASAEIDAALAWAALAGNRIVTLADPDYPQRLLETPDPPTLLYVKGCVALLNAKALRMRRRSLRRWPMRA